MIVTVPIHLHRHYTCAELIFKLSSLLGAKWDVRERAIRNRDERRERKRIFGLAEKESERKKKE